MARTKGSKNKGSNTPPTEVQQDIFTATSEQLAESYAPPTTNEGESAANYDIEDSVLGIPDVKPITQELVDKISDLVDGVEVNLEDPLPEEDSNATFKELLDSSANQFIQEGINQALLEASKTQLESTITDSEYQGSQEAPNASESNVEPIEAIAVEGSITHSLTISGVHLNQVVSELLKVAYCGATLTPKKLPRLSKLPYQVFVQIDDDGYNQYMDSDSAIVYDEQEDYNHLVVSHPDPLKFVQEIMVIGAKGAVIPDRKSCTHIGGRYQVKLATCKAIAPNANVKVKAKKRIYTRDELHAMKMADLKIIAGYYKITLAGNKPLAVKQLLEKQAEITQ